MESTPPKTYTLSKSPVLIGLSYEKEILANSSSIMNRDIGTIRHKTQFETTCEVNTMGENSSFIFTCYVKTVPVYDFRLV